MNYPSLTQLLTAYPPAIADRLLSQLWLWYSDQLRNAYAGDVPEGEFTNLVTTEIRSHANPYTQIS